MFCVRQCETCLLAFQQELELDCLKHIDLFAFWFPSLANA